MQVYLCDYEIGNKRFKGDWTFIIKKKNRFILTPSYKKKGLLYLYVSDSLQKSLTDHVLWNAFAWN